MGQTNRTPDLNLQSDPTHEEREWIVQRVGWALMFLLILAVLGGGFGSGPLSEKAEGKEGFHVKYQRFGRYQAPAKIQFFCQLSPADHFALKLDRDFIEAIEITEISPEPEQVITEGKHYVYEFKQGDGDPHLVTFRLKAEKFGRSQSSVTLDNKATVQIRMFFWP